MSKQQYVTGVGRLQIEELISLMRTLRPGRIVGLVESRKADTDNSVSFKFHGILQYNPELDLFAIFKDDDTFKLDLDHVFDQIIFPSSKILSLDIIHRKNRLVVSIFLKS